ncbi:hypothetical protein V495_07688 [Pseudogymnoascus sp. VKM F-4514 (FW-929)]|nr:hypothetical protein V495_07688 [Pseudogymnoascus sp. VKM F-4514 (FW-929)]
MATLNSIVLVSPKSAHEFTISILEKYGVPLDRAALVADSLVLADLRGVDTHGINRLGGYIERIKHNVLDPNPTLTFVMKTPVMAHLDAQNTFGFVAGSVAIDKGIEIASTFGIGIVAVKNSNHYGMAATYLVRAINAGFAAFAFTNASRSMPPWGAKEPLFGTSPFAVGIPGGKEGDFLLDMSPSVAARGKIRKAARRGEKIPEGYALDEEGRPTTDAEAALRGVVKAARRGEKIPEGYALDEEGRPTTDAEAALRGVVLPIGGPKGSGLAMMMDLFGGLMSGASFAGGVNDQYKNMDEPQGVGHWFMVFKPDMFLDSKEEFISSMDTLMTKVRGCEKAAGVDRIYTSGEIERGVEEKRRGEGIPYTQGEIDALHCLAKESGSDRRLI